MLCLDLMILICWSSFLFDVKELEELHSALEEAKADIVGLWALRFLINQVSYLCIFTYVFCSSFCQYGHSRAIQKVLVCFYLFLVFFTFDMSKDALAYILFVGHPFECYSSMGHLSNAQSGIIYLVIAHELHQSYHTVRKVFKLLLAQMNMGKTLVFIIKGWQENQILELD